MLKDRLPAVVVLSLMVVVVATGCGPADADRKSSGASGGPPSRPLAVALRGEPLELSSTGSGRSAITFAMFNAPLVGLDHAVPYAVLSRGIPELRTESWQVFPDGRMQTTYQLNPGLTWHDGTPLSAEDYVLAWRLEVAGPELNLPTESNIETTKAMEDVLAPNAGTVVILWRQLFAEAATPDFYPVPRHLMQATLASALEQGRGEIIMGHPYWTTEFVGLGPYQLTRWEPGAYLEGAAFGGYALGRPKIERIVVTWNTDPNVTMARMLAGEVNLALDAAIDFRQAIALRRDWRTTGNGVVILAPVQIRFLATQSRPALANPKAILDLRVRKAIIHAIDRPGLVDALLEGEGQVADTLALPGEPFEEALDRVVTKYPFDLRRTEALMQEAGLFKGPEGMYRSAEGPFSPEMLGIAEGLEGQEATILADFLRRASIDAQLRLVPSVQMQASNEMKATFPAFRANQAISPMVITTAAMAAPENRWSGRNKSGYSNPEHDRLFDIWTQTLDRKERDDLSVQMYKGMNDDLPGLPLYFNFWVIAHSSELQGPKARVPETMPLYGNLHLWQWPR
jgi:peptide/nickel transport system substrate-binding protein